LGRIYSKLGGGEEKRTPQKLTTRNKILGLLPLRMKRWISLESHDAIGSNMGRGLEIECLEHFAALTAFDVVCS
jgi:hypothetical protein